MPIHKPKPKKKLPVIKERRYVKKIKTPRQVETTKDVRFIRDGFEGVRRDNPRSEENHFIKVARQREAIKDYYDRLDLLKQMRKAADAEGDWEFDERKVEFGEMGGGHKHKTKHKRSRHKSRRLGHKHSRRKSHKRKSSRHKRSRHKRHKRKSKTRRR